MDEFEFASQRNIAIDLCSLAFESSVNEGNATPKPFFRSSLGFESECVKVVLGEVEDDFSLWLHVIVDDNDVFEDYEALHTCYVMSLDESEEARHRFVSQVGAILSHVLRQDEGISAQAFDDLARNLAAYGLRPHAAPRAAGKLLHTPSCLDATKQVH